MLVLPHVKLRFALLSVGFICTCLLNVLIWLFVFYSLYFVYSYICFVFFFTNVGLLEVQFDYMQFS